MTLRIIMIVKWTDKNLKLPVEDTKRAPSFGDYEALKKKKKKE